MVRTRNPGLGQDLARERAEAPLHSISDDRAAHFLGDGDPKPDGRILISPLANEKHESWGRDALSTVGGEKVPASPENGQADRI